jgi:hypothetical protein
MAAVPPGAHRPERPESSPRWAVPRERGSGGRRRPAAATGLTSEGAVPKGICRPRRTLGTGPGPGSLGHVADTCAAAGGMRLVIDRAYFSTPIALNSRNGHFQELPSSATQLAPPQR